MSDNSVCMRGNCTPVVGMDNPGDAEGVALCSCGDMKLNAGSGSDREREYGVPMGIYKFLSGVCVDTGGTYGGVTSRRAIISQSLCSH
jgi:hypothetical protein